MSELLWRGSVKELCEKGVWNNLRKLTGNMYRAYPPDTDIITLDQKTAEELGLISPYATLNYEELKYIIEQPPKSEQPCDDCHGKNAHPEWCKVCTGIEPNPEVGKEEGK